MLLPKSKRTLHHYTSAIRNRSKYELDTPSQHYTGIGFSIAYPIWRILITRKDKCSFEGAEISLFPGHHQQYDCYVAYIECLSVFPVQDCSKPIYMFFQRLEAVLYSRVNGAED